MNIRRYYFPGQIVFITQVVKKRTPIFLNEDMVTLLKANIRYTKDNHSFKILAYVILPDHFHLLIQPNGESNFSQIMHAMKSRFTRAYKKKKGISNHINLWQRRFWDHVIRDEQDFENHFHYIHFNPIKHGYVDHPNDWVYSSYIEWLKRGVYTGTEMWKESENGRWGE
jgi:putative transposase